MKTRLAEFMANEKSDTLDAYKIVLILALLISIATILSNGTLVRAKNIENMLNQNSILVLIALSQFLVILSGGLDLSVGAVTAITSVLIVQYQDAGGFVAVLIALGVAFVIGLTTGTLITYRKLPPFVVTLAMMQIVYSLAKVLCSGAPVYAGLGGAKIDERLAGMFRAKLLGIPCPIIVCVAAIIIVVVYMRTSYGRFIYAIGGNESAARMSGLPVDAIKVSLYVVSAVMAAMASMLFVARVGMGDPNTGMTLPINSIAAVTIGGGALTGGIGTVAGTVTGVYILSVLGNIMSLLSIPPTIQPAIKGAVILLAVYLNSRRKRV